MNAIIVAIVLLIAVGAFVFGAVRLTRNPNTESPKRRELRRANAAALAAQRTMNDVEQIFDRYRTFIVNDPVAAPMADEIADRIRKYKTEILELDK